MKEEKFERDSRKALLVNEVDDERDAIQEIQKESKSNFLQSLFNAINVILGIGILSFPYAIRVSGLLPGCLLSVFCALLASYTARLIAFCMDSAPNINNYSDMGYAAFGNRGRILISTVLFFELLVVSITMLILAGDTLSNIFPSIDTKLLTFFAFLLATPLTYFKNLSYLAVSSVFGILATLVLVMYLFLDGLGVTGEDVPGSGCLINPAPDIQVIADPFFSFPLAFGLMMSGYSGHGIFPGIYRNMEDPSRYPLLMTVSFLTASSLYTFTGVIGYLIFGLAVQPLVDSNLVDDNGSKTSHIIALIIFVSIFIIPITKIPLAMNPVNTIVESFVIKSPPHAMTLRENVIRIAIRTGMATVVLIVAAFYPNFQSIMALLGAFFCFTL